ncbi:putative hemicentin-1-like isoform X1 [Penaeus vannamei]|uniref:Putative hemicentin-1-like isoform X1 n=1 Tax=Penaeus vannamei TaxID=6689 RepID=A0A423SYX8_PENVA|nr:putative hemicentin-1-like isoform X1 [Penaeus vannamei]
MLHHDGFNRLTGISEASGKRAQPQTNGPRKAPLASLSKGFIGLFAACPRRCLCPRGCEWALRVMASGWVFVAASLYDDRTAQQHLGIREDDVTLTSRGAATITIKKIHADSGGLYECRVDFFRSPTHNSFVNLTVIEPPRNVEIADSQSGTSDDGIVGPYYENQEVILNCFSRSGNPLPNVTWWRGERVLDGGWEVAGPGLVRNTLVIDRITREWHNSTLTCTASNTHLASPAVASVVVHMFLLPTSVIITNPGPTREGQRTALTCSARGSRPLADLSWSVRGKTLDAVKVEPDKPFLVLDFSLSVPPMTNSPPQPPTPNPPQKPPTHPSPPPPPALITHPHPNHPHHTTQHPPHPHHPPPHTTPPSTPTPSTPTPALTHPPHPQPLPPTPAFNPPNPSTPNPTPPKSPRLASSSHVRDDDLSPKLPRFPGVSGRCRDPE